MTDPTESCGRCGLSSVVDTVEDESDDGRSPFDRARIEVPEGTMRRAAFIGVRLDQAKRRLDAAAHAVTYGRR